MLCTQIVFCFDIQNNLCTQHVLCMFWACNFHVLNLKFNEQSFVIFWVSWCKNKCFWKRFTCNTLCISWIKVDLTVKILFYVHTWERISRDPTTTSKRFYHKGIVVWSFWRNRFENSWSLINFIRKALENIIYLQKSSSS